jgi:DNA mismatch repair protein MutS
MDIGKGPFAGHHRPPCTPVAEPAPTGQASTALLACRYRGLSLARQAALGYRIGMGRAGDTGENERDGERVTPSMAQYIEIKAANPDSLLFYRMGDFYELFFDDAEIASRTLGIVLTKRGRHQGQDIPMCGVPVIRADEYLQRLIAAGHRVAVCEQLEDPAEARKRGSKAVVRRDVVRLVTAGTITEETLLDPARASVLLAVARVRRDETAFAYGLAEIDISTGRFDLSETDDAGLAAEIARIDPREIVLPDAIRDDPALDGLWRSQRAAMVRMARDGLDGASAERRIAEWFGVATLDGFGRFPRAALMAAAAALAYIARTQVGAKPLLSPPAPGHGGGGMRIDAATRANLELTRTLAGERAGSLLAAVDLTVTPGGARLLAERLAGPLADAAAIDRRLDSVAFLVGDALRRERLRAALRDWPDLPRSLSRLGLDRGGPRDLLAVGQALAVAGQLAAILKGAELPGEIAAAVSALVPECAGLGSALAEAVTEGAPLQKRDGGFVREGHSADLDAARALRDDSRRVIAGLQGRYQSETEARTLRIKHNNFLGYFVEVPQRDGERMLAPPHQGRFIHRQTMQDAMRFTTAELGELESRIAGAADRSLAIELAIFDALRTRVTAAAAALAGMAEAVARLDVAAAAAELAVRRGWARPQLTDDLAFDIREGRHPVVEEALARDGRTFIANHCDLSGLKREDGGRILLVTGPNMAGKSTFLRQNALITVLAQAGLFVPAASARIGIVDRLFSRVGAADDLARGRSTFMVEMVETAAILNQAGPRALVILDEIGRGTATFDGLSIAWAAIEHLHESNRSRALFATHYHELTALSDRLPRLANVTMRVTEYRGDVIFLHEVTTGAADRSYGIQVARLAGLPPAVIERARLVLAELEKGERQSPVQAMIDDLPLFAAAPARRQPPGAPAMPDRLREALDALDPDELTPRAALEALYRLKAAARETR